MRYLILFAAFLFTVPSAKAEGKNLLPAIPVRAVVDYCFAALKDGIGPADYAAAKQLPEFPPEQAVKFSPDGGRVFGISGAEGNAVLMTSKSHQGACSVAIHEINPEVFWKAVDLEFGMKSPFKLMREKRLDEESITKRNYEGDLNGPVALLITASDMPRKNGMQALITAARFQK